MKSRFQPIFHHEANLRVVFFHKNTDLSRVQIIDFEGLASRKTVPAPQRFFSHLKFPLGTAMQKKCSPFRRSSSCVYSSTAVCPPICNEHHLFASDAG